MKGFGFVSKAIIAGLALGFLTSSAAWSSTVANGATANQANGVQARQLLDSSARDYDQISFGFINNPSPQILNEYQTEYALGLDAYQRGDYQTAIGHLTRAEDVLHGTSEWAERQ